MNNKIKNFFKWGCYLQQLNVKIVDDNHHLFVCIKSGKYQVYRVSDVEFNGSVSEYMAALA